MKTIIRGLSGLLLVSRVTATVNARQFGNFPYSPARRRVKQMPVCLSARPTEGPALALFLRAGVLLAILVWVSSLQAQAPRSYDPPYFAFTNFAGLPDSSGAAVDGLGSVARFTQPEAVAVDPAGNIFVGDTQNFTVRKITPDGLVSTLAGRAGQGGTADGPGSEARFWYTKGLATDVAGNVYVADEVSHTIRKITPAGEVSTLAGRPGPPGYTNGPGSVARFNRPSALAVDIWTNIYVADTYNRTIRRITPAGEVSTLAGRPGVPGSVDGQGTNATFVEPLGIAVNGAGVVFIADFSAKRIRRIAPDGVVTTLAGGAGTPRDGLGSGAGFSGPHGLALDGLGHLLVADTYGGTLRRVTPSGMVTTVAGAEAPPASADGIAAAARFNGPRGVAVDAAGNLYVADTQNNRVTRGVAVAGEVELRITGPEWVDGRPHVQLRLSGPPGLKVRLETASSLPHPGWFAQQTYLLDGNGVVVAFPAAVSRAFFRPRVVP